MSQQKNVQIFEIKVTGAKDLRKLEQQLNRVAKAKTKMGSASSSADKNITQMNTRTKSLGRSMGKTLGIIGAVTIAIRALSKIVADGINTFKGFEFAMAKVKAISGATDKEFRKLQNSALRLGKTTFFTASQVAELQLNLSKLGFNTTEILQSQEAILLLSQAMGDDLGRTATVVASTIRGFGEDTVQTARYADVLAKAFSNSALDLEKFQTSMSKVSAIAAMAGFSLEDTTALLGTLTDRGIEASIAGTSLRNILLHLQDPTSDLSERLGRTVHSGEDLIVALKELKDSGINVAGVMGIVQRRQVMAMNSFIDSADSIGDFIEMLEDAKGATQEMSDIMEDTLLGAQKQATSAWEGLNQQLLKGNGILADITRGWTNFLLGITDDMMTASDKADEVVDQQMKNATAQAASREILLSESMEHTEKLMEKELSLKYDELEELKKVEGFHTDIQQKAHNKQLRLAKRSFKAQELAIERFNELRMEQNIIEEDAAEQKRIDAENAQLDAAEELRQQTDIILLLKKKIEAVEKEAAVDEKEQKDKNIRLDGLKKKLKELQTLGLETDKVIGSVGGISTDEMMTSNMMNLEREQADARAGYLSAYLENAMTKEQLDAQLHQLELDRLREIKQMREDLGLSTEEQEGQILDLKVKQQEASKKTADEDTKATQKMMENAIMNSDNANQAFQKIVTTKINEILLEAMSSLWSDKTIPFFAKVGLALGMKAFVSPMIEKMFGSREKFAEGGLTGGGMFQGASHANGGVKFAVGGRIHEAEGGEAIINKKSTALFKPMLSAMNSFNGYGKKFADGGITTGISNKFALGGMTASSLSTMASEGGLGSTVMVVESDITKTQGRVSAIESQASF